MNKNIMKAVGFGREVKLVEAGRCPVCMQQIILTEFKNQISKKEYKISGICQKCQDEMFRAF